MQATNMYGMGLCSFRIGEETLLDFRLSDFIFTFSKFGNIALVFGTLVLYH